MECANSEYIYGGNITSGILYISAGFSAYISANYRKTVLIHQIGFPTLSNKIIGIRRYVAIVPYRTALPSTGPTTLVLNALVNAAVLLFWFCGAALFTVVRVAMRRCCVLAPTTSTPRRSTNQQKTKVLRIFLGTLARVLGNNAGRDTHPQRPSESWLICVVGAFATLTAMLFTGDLFEQLIKADPVRQIDTLAELRRSNLSVRVCREDTNLNHLYITFQK